MKIIPDSHLDHGLTDAHLGHILQRFEGRREFFVASFELPAHLPDVPCGLHGPAMGDEPVPSVEVAKENRPGRAYPSRLVLREPRMVRTMTVIAGPHGEDPCVLYTAFGGPLTPREPDDPTLPDDKRQEAIEFWSEHALSRPSASTRAGV